MHALTTTSKFRGLQLVSSSKMLFKKQVAWPIGYRFYLSKSIFSTSINDLIDAERLKLALSLIGFFNNPRLLAKSLASTF